MVLAPDSQRLLFTEARTANTFTDKPVSDERLRAIYELAKFAPTSANTNPLRILFLRQGEGRDRLIPHMAEGNRSKTAGAPAVAVLASDHAFHERIPELLPVKPELREFFDADEVLRDKVALYNGALQAAYFILAVRAAGLAAGPMAGFDAAGIDAEFFADSTWRSHLVVNIGEPGPGAWSPRLPRLGYEDVVRYG
ncbi:MAG: malonic semialdehyde reductase [Solirubrobacterales bacterium]